jgi:hypothetical protein
MARALALFCTALVHGAAAYVGARPSVVARQRGHVALVSQRTRVITLSSAARPGGDGGKQFYRTLGVTPDAAYDEVLDAFASLVAAAGADAARVVTLERARDGILDSRLKARLSGEAPIKREEVKKLKRKRDWLKPLKFLGKYTMKPTLEHAKKVSLFLVFAFIAFTTRMGDQLLLFSVIFGMGFVYNHGQPEPVRDDSGYEGEIHPTKMKPMFLAFILVLTSAFIGNLIGSFYISFLVPSKTASVSQVTNACTCVAVWLATLFLKTQL